MQATAPSPAAAPLRVWHPASGAQIIAIPAGADRLAVINEWAAAGFDVRTATAAEQGIKETDPGCWFMVTWHAGCPEQRQYRHHAKDHDLELLRVVLTPAGGESVYGCRRCGALID